MKTIIYTTAIIFSIANCFAQCPNGLLYSVSSTGDIEQYNPSTGTTSSTGITGAGPGLAYGPNINGGSPSPTFYTTGGFGGAYFYWDGAAWVNTGHSAGPGTNIAAGGGFIYSIDWGTGQVYKYDGTGPATLLMTLSIGLGDIIADIAVDNCGNLYVLKQSSPQSLTVYNSSGTVLGSYTISGLPVSSGSAPGLAIIGTTVYVRTTAGYVGTISGSNISFVPGGGAWAATPVDFASCPTDNSSFCPLPITLLTFTGNCTVLLSFGEGMGVRLQWSTATETNNDYFTIERSTSPDPSKGGALNWEVAGTVKGAGNSSTVRSYKFIDNQVLPFGEDLGGVVYYRLSQTDYDGKTEIFNDKQIAVDITECATKVFPNPAGNTLNVPYVAEQDGEITLQVYDVIGKLVKEKAVAAVKGHNTFTLDLTTVAQGMYVLSVKNGAKELNQKFVKGN